MSQRSPTVEGFRAAFRRPSLSIAEIVWRWSVGATATALFLFGFFEYLNTLPVTNGEVLFLRTRHPYLVAEAMAHILRGSLNRGVMALLLAALLVGLLWMVAASVGRIATVRVLLDYFRRDVASNVSTGGASIQGEKDAAEISSGKGLATRGFPSDGERDVASNASTSASFVALVRLQFLRAAVALAGVFGFMGAAILAGFASPDANPQPGLAFFLFLPVAALICWVWWCLNWLLSLAGMFAVRDGEDAVAAIAVSVAFCRERTGAVFAVSTWTGSGASGRLCGGFHGRLGAAGLRRHRAVAVGGCGRDSRDSGLFRACRLVVHGTSRRICLHRGNAAGIVGAIARRAVAQAGAAGPDHHRPR